MLCEAEFYKHFNCSKFFSGVFIPTFVTKCSYNGYGYWKGKILVLECISNKER